MYGRTLSRAQAHDMVETGDTVEGRSVGLRFIVDFLLHSIISHDCDGQQKVCMHRVAFQSR